MKKVFYTMVIIVVLGMLFTVSAEAGVWGKAKSWLTGEVLALIASTILALLGGVLGLMFRKIARTFKELGEFLSAIGMAIEDRRIDFF